MCIWGKGSRQRIKIRCILPKKQVPEGTRKGEKISVFIYRDSSDRLIATVREPKILLGQIGVLKWRRPAVSVHFWTGDWKKDLFLPYKEQTKKLHEGEEVLVALYIDKSSRLCATMKSTIICRRIRLMHREIR